MQTSVSAGFLCLVKSKICNIFLHTSALSAKRVLDIIILPIRLSQPGTDTSPGEIDSGFLPYDSVGSRVSCEEIWCHWVRRFPSNEGLKEGYPPPSPLEIVI